eukprot:136451-Chlamydomonas_euryale.AAC.1
MSATASPYTMRLSSLGALNTRSNPNSSGACGAASAGPKRCCSGAVAHLFAAAVAAAHAKVALSAAVTPLKTRPWRSRVGAHAGCAPEAASADSSGRSRAKTRTLSTGGGAMSLRPPPPPMAPSCPTDAVLAAAASATAASAPA